MTLQMRMEPALVADRRSCAISMGDACEKSLFELPAAPQISVECSLDAEPIIGESHIVRQLLTEARDIHNQYSAKNILCSVAASTDNIAAIAIGQVLFNAFRKDLIQVDMTPSEVLDAVLTYDTGTRPGATISRIRFIAALKSLGIVDPARHDRFYKPAGTTPNLRAIGALVEANTKITLDEIASPSRARETVKARFMAIWVMRTVCGHSLSMIGGQMGGRDHTTILNSINKVALQIETEASTRKAMEILCEKADMAGVIQNRSMLLRQIPN